MRARDAAGGGVTGPGVGASAAPRRTAAAPRRPRVVVVAEYYPRVADPVLGVWAHRQALAARDAGADVRVLVLHRPVPSYAALRRRRPAELVAPLRQPLHTRINGLRVTYVPFLAPPRPRSYSSWGRYAAPPLALALRALRARFPFDLVHAHYAAPAGDAVLRARIDVPLVVSVHGGDAYGVAEDGPDGLAAVTRALSGARIVIAHSGGVADRCRALGAGDVRVVHLGTDVPARRARARRAARRGRRARALPPAVRAPGARARRRRSRDAAAGQGRAAPTGRARRRPGACARRGARP